MRRRVALVGLALVLAAGLAVRFSGFQVSPESLAALVREAGTSAWGPLVFLGLYLVFTSVAVPAMLFHIASGVLWGFGPGVAMSLVATNLVSNLHFGVGRLFGAGPLKSLVERRGIAGLFERSRTEGPWLMIGVRQLPLPFVGVNVAAGASAMPWWHFLVGSGLGGLVPVLVWNWFADEVFHDPQAVRPAILVKAVLAAALGLGVAVVGRWLASRVRPRPAP